MTNEEYLFKLHQVLLEIFDFFCSLCEKHNLQYFLIGGTLLGAVRHQGFIPWDDDLDVGMPRKDYEKFIEVCAEELKGKNYWLQSYKTDPTYWLKFAKIRKQNTLFLEDIYEYSAIPLEHQGMFIDIFPFDRVKAPEGVAQVRGRVINKLQMCLWRKMKISKDNSLKNKLAALVPHRLTLHLQNFLMKFGDSAKENNYYVSYGSHYGIKKDSFPVEGLLPFHMVQFECRSVHAPAAWDVYLKNLYGDYMKIPPMEDRVTHEPVKVDFGNGLETIERK